MHFNCLQRSPQFLSKFVSDMASEHGKLAVFLIILVITEIGAVLSLLFITNDLDSFKFDFIGLFFISSIRNCLLIFSTI